MARLQIDRHLAAISEEQAGSWPTRSTLRSQKPV
jgi:hypothetical protein